MVIHVGDLVFVRPSCSLKFGGRWGKVVSINSKDSMPIHISFNGSISFRFSPSELLPSVEYQKYKDIETFCEGCGKDITGEFETLCGDCIERRVFYGR